MRQDVAWSGLHLKGMRLGSLVFIDHNEADNSSKEDKNIEYWIFNKLSVSVSCMNIHTIEKGALVKPGCFAMDSYRKKKTIASCAN